MLNVKCEYTDATALDFKGVDILVQATVNIQQCETLNNVCNNLANVEMLEIMEVTVFLLCMGRESVKLSSVWISPGERWG